MDSKTNQRLVGLDPREYEHPLDREALDKLEAIPGAKALFTKISEVFTEKFLEIELNGSYILLTKGTYPRIHKILNEASRILDMGWVPPIYISGWDPGGSYTINAWTNGSKVPHIVLTRRALDELDDLELLALLGHELGHIKSGHVLYTTIAEYLADNLGEAISSLTLGMGNIAVLPIQYALHYWYRMSEFTADRAGLLVSQDINVYTRFLLKLSDLLPNDADIVSFQNSFIEQAKSFKDFDHKNVNKLFKLISTFQQTHPYTVLRVSELIEWEKNDQYKNILTRKKVNIVTKIPSESKFCPNCSTDLSTGDRFCGGCGSEIS